jgi:hypothetical protein
MKTVLSLLVVGIFFIVLSFFSFKDQPSQAQTGLIPGQMSHSCSMKQILMGRILYTVCQ